MLIAKIHKQREKSVLAVCDEELLGKKFTEGRLQLDLTSNFYAGEQMSEEMFKQEAAAFDILNMVGERVIALAKEMGLVEEEHVVVIQNIPHAQCISLNPVP